MEYKLNIDVMWVGLSHKVDKNNNNLPPLCSNTNSGKLVDEIEEKYISKKFYRTNLVKYPPLDSNGKLRYPTDEECLLA